MASLRQIAGTVRSDLSKRRPPKGDPEELERNIRVNVYHGIASITALNLAAPFVSIFAVKLGASDYQVGLLSSGPAFLSLISMIPGARLIDKQPLKRRAVSLFILLHRLFYLFVASIPFFTSDKRAWLMVIAVSFMNIPASIGNVGWQAFISKVVPMERRAQAFASRSRLMNIAGTGIVLIAGRLIDVIGYPFGYQIMFVCAFLLSLVEIWVLGHVDESPDPAVADSGHAKVVGGGPSAEASSGSPGPRGFAAFKATAKEILGHDKFVRYTLASIVFYLSWQTPWPLFTLYQVNVLGANNTWVSLLSLTNTGGTLLGYGFWAKKCNQIGNLSTLFLASLGIFVVPLAYAVSKSLVTIAALNLLSGIVFSGVNLALLNQLLEVTPEENKTTYIAYYTTAVNVAAIVAPMLGVTLLESLDFFGAFMACAVLRFVCSFGFLLVKKLDAKAEQRKEGAVSAGA